MVNNFDILRSLLNFESENDFYFLQILKRRKDNPDMERDMIVVSDFYINSLDKFDSLKDKIIGLCDMENARAYLRLNRRDYKKTGLQMLRRISDLIISENYKPIKSCFSSVAGEYHSDPDKKWIVDIDGINEDSDKIFAYLTALQIEAGREPMTEKIPTKNGYHYITRPFNLQTFKSIFPNVDVHKDNPTVLYIP